MRRFLTGLLILLSAVSLLLASTSLWTRRHVINTEVFVADTETMLAQPAVQARITDRVTSTVMATPEVQQAVDDAVAVLPDRLQRFEPTIEEGIRSIVATGTQRLLTSDRFTDLTDAALTSAHTQLVAGEPVRFTLGQAKDLVPADRRDGVAGQVLSLVPDDVGVTLVTPADAPQLYTAIDLLQSVWWWFGVLALATLAGALALSRNRRGTLRAWAVTTAVLGLLALVALRVARGPVLSAAQPINRDAVGAIWDVVAGSLRAWTIWLVALALVVLVLTLVWGRLGLVAAVRRGARTAAEQVRHRREEHAAARALAAERAPGEPGAVVPAGESWPRRVAADTRAFVAGMDLDRRVAGLGTFVAAHLRPARWIGIVAGAVVLLLWPAPTLSVLVWIAALVALWLGLLEWLAARAPEPAAEAPAEPPVPPPARPAPAGGEAAGQPLPAPAPGAPSPDQAPVPSARPSTDGVPGATLVVTRSAEPAVPPLPAAGALTPEVLAGLGGRLDLIVRLGAAHDAGVLTDDEFAREKNRLLAL
ncbi:SHOCT domain-containing protein [Geodermatophilus ruber]|uniref:Short C-terminal domain-containing protein n=1 Tax=Geodermatophilus ruber TaxID=504800 RepID=A0A1I4FAJ7_9ACTN|nr:SHOCT domain-containing protein [Geodermatophilus ruber]SFL15032.1 hypothetical protein SAMN04488085_10763 [Geodermatophilus ruber]